MVLKKEGYKMKTEFEVRILEIDKNIKDNEPTE